MAARWHLPAPGDRVPRPGLFLHHRRRAGDPDRGRARTRRIRLPHPGDRTRRLPWPRRHLPRRPAHHRRRRPRRAGAPHPPPRTATGPTGSLARSREPLRPRHRNPRLDPPRGHRPGPGRCHQHHLRRLPERPRPDRTPQPATRPASGKPVSGTAVMSLRSACLVLRVDTVLAEQGAEPLDLVGELLDPLGQKRQRRVPGDPLLLPRGLGGQQFLFPVTPRRGLLKVLGVDGGFLLAANLSDLLVQVTGVRPGSYPVLKYREPDLDHVQASLYLGPRCTLQERPTGDEVDDLLAHPVQVGAQPDQHLGGHPVALTDQAEQDVLGTDVVVAELQRFTQRQLEHLLAPGRERDVPGRRLLARADDLLDPLPDRVQADPQRLQRLGRDTFALTQEAEQDVLGADVVVVEQPGFFLRQDHHPARPVGKPLEHRLPRTTERNLAARRRHRTDGACPDKPVMTPSRYAPVAASKAVLDRGAAHSTGNWSLGSSRDAWPTIAVAAQLASLLIRTRLPSRSRSSSSHPYGGSPSGRPNSATTASTSLTNRWTRVSSRASPWCSDRNNRARSRTIDTNAGSRARRDAPTAR